MKIPVEIMVGCKIMFFATGNLRVKSGTVTAIRDDLIETRKYTLNIKSITHFTFGGIWMTNHKFQIYSHNVTLGKI